MAEAKIATCCYCGSRTTLRPTAREGHALACAQCGAALTRMKPLSPELAARAAAHPRASQPMPLKRKKTKKSKRKKGFFEKLVREVWDEIEDILD
jgi:PHP family Zn ribbon phosphoesterase